MRNQRLIEYTNFLTKSTEVETAVDDYSTMLLASDGATHTPQERNAGYSRLDSAENEYINASWRVGMIASEAVGEVCGKMSSVVYDTSNNWRIRPNGEIDVTKMSASRISEFGAEMAKLRLEFMNASRQDLDQAGQ